MGEDHRNHCGIDDGGDDLQVAATVCAVFHIDIDMRLSRQAQLMRAGAEAGGLWASWSQASWVLSGALGTISALKLARGASYISSQASTNLTHGCQCGRIKSRYQSCVDLRAFQRVFGMI